MTREELLAAFDPRARVYRADQTHAQLVGYATTTLVRHYETKNGSLERRTTKPTEDAPLFAVRVGTINGLALWDTPTDDSTCETVWLVRAD